MSKDLRRMIDTVEAVCVCVGTAAGLAAWVAFALPLVLLQCVVLKLRGE